MSYDHPVVVTGGAGLLGREVVARLESVGCRDIRVIDLHSHPSSTVASHVLDLRSGGLGDAVRGAGTVLHLAACQYHSPLASSTYRLPFFEINVDATRRLLAAAITAGVRRFVFVSTNMVYGLPQQCPLTEDHPRVPIGPYGRSKRDAEDLVTERIQSGAIGGAIIRPGLMIGPGRTGVIARIFEWVLAGRDVWLIGGGRNRYQMTAVSDCAQLVMLAGLADRFGVYNCGSVEVPLQREWVQALIGDAGSGSRVRTLPGGVLKPVLRALEAMRASPLRGDQYEIADLDYVMDVSAARQQLGWDSRLSDTAAIRETFAWYREHGRIRPGRSEPGARRR